MKESWLLEKVQVIFVIWSEEDTNLIYYSNDTYDRQVSSRY